LHFPALVLPLRSGLLNRKSSKTSASSTILILGDRSDNQVTRVQAILSRRGERWESFDPFGQIELPPVRICPSEEENTTYSAIWDRMKPIALGSLDEKAQYIIRERAAAVRGIQLLCEKTSRQMNPPLATDRSKSKLSQLRTAGSEGLLIPRTHVGNDIEGICRFIRECGGKAIAKSLTWFVGDDARISYTKLVTTSEILAAPASTAYSPLIYQEYIQKKNELRITCVGSKVFAAEIDSQTSHKATIDWRRDQFRLKYRKVEIPRGLRRKILSVQSALGLKFGAYDFIVTPKDDYVFLEVNPTGNWLWLEDELGMPISEEIVDWLVGNTN
jgi:glutathione synthase/RimK-type ligase-like ATP-grasp enzyme